MTIVRYESPQEYLQRVGEFLYRAEAENNLILGIVERLVREEKTEGEKRWMLAIEDQGKVVGAAWVSEPRYGLVVTRLPAEVVGELVNYLIREEVPLTGSVGPGGIPAEISKLIRERTGRDVSLRFRQRIYRCSEVNHPAGVSGKLREAVEEELELMKEWSVAFERESGVTSPAGTIEKFVTEEISKRRLFVWDDGGPVSSAAAFRETRNGITVVRVYTPEALRRKGYAAAIVAGLTQLHLERGKEFCSLYTDLANPTSNSIYQKIGYVPVCDSEEWRFE
ncbi:MAG: GNAT family N-acetyltransferase [Planctomycetaceae bacterium]|nr:GNAT family N-acetyltransferase [Planctomycetaceae bacterium]